MMSFSDDKQGDLIDTFNTTFRYLEDILNINSIYFDDMVSMTNTRHKNTNDPQKKYHLGMVSKNIVLEGLH